VLPLVDFRCLYRERSLVADENDAQTPPFPPLGEEELRAQLQDTERALQSIERAWVEHYYGGAPPSAAGQVRRDAERVVDISNPEWVSTPEQTRVLAYAFVQAADRCVEALEKLKAQIAYTHPEEAEELYQRIRKLRGGEEYTTNP